MEITDIQPLLDYGFAIVVSLVLLTKFFNKLDSMEDKLVKILTLLTVVVKGTTEFNHVDKVLGSDHEKVSSTIDSAVDPSL